MKGARGLYLLSMIVQTLVVFSTLFTTFLSKVLTDTLMASFNGEPLVADSLLEGWAINIITFGAGEEYLLNHLYILPIAILVSGLLSALLTCLRFFTRVKASATINKTSQMAVFSKITELPYAHFKKTKSGELLQTATRDLDVFRRFIMQDFGSINYTFWMVLICLSVLLSLNWKYTLISFSPFPIMFIYSFFLIKKVRSLYRETDDSEARMTDKIAENLNAVRIVKAYNAETYEIAEFEGKLKDYRKHFISWRKFSSFFFSSSDIFVFGADAISLIYGLALCFNGEIKPGTLVVAVSFVSMTVWPLRNVATILSNVGQVLASVDRINLILNAETEDRKSGLTPEIKGHIVFDHVSYHYEDEDSGVIKDVSFEVKPGQTIAIMGKTGSGKSTLLSLLTRLYDYTGGEILLDGTPLKDIQKEHLRHNIVPVLQDPFLFSKSIYENIRLANKDATRAEIERSAKIAAVHETISSFKDGYDTPVGEKGVTLSGGQKQRVAIARTIASKAPILLFDDSLSAVDTETDLEIRSHLKELGNSVTTIIITHRVMTAKDADLIVVLDDGRVSEMGKHEDLIKQEGLYKDIYEIQSQTA
ncbi:MAG: ABC transporter ATP-binding protein [Bacilli bacterium]|nr:ABC transporter ATP-binding protein [Bacilli bacterium]MEE3442944.1 ABC transporter ATP-binding protein [Candidatus Enteromonas sp.]